jgi:Enoyl-CoA hydratase/carnithine racemase
MTIAETRAEGGIAILRLDRERSLNAMNEAMVDALEDAIARLAGDDGVSALVITGTGRAFCVGSDLKEDSGADPDSRVRRMHALMLRLLRYPKVTVCAVNGLALGGGLELALPCTFRVASPAARFGLPEVTHDLMPAYGGTQLLPRLIGRAPAIEMALSGEMIDAAEALRTGLVDRIADDCLAEAVALARRCSAGGAIARREILAAIIGGLEGTLEEGLEKEHAGVMVVSSSDAARAGVEQFRKGHS